jgi:hypothetical protein
MSRKTLLLVLAVAAAILAGCARLHTVKIDAISRGITQGNAYVLQPPPGVEQSDLHFQTYSAYVKQALAMQGFRGAKSLEDADLAIRMACGLGDPREKVSTWTEPVYSQPGYKDVSGYVNGQYVEAQVYQEKEVVGHRRHVDVNTVCTKSLTLSAHDAANPAVQLWKVVVTTSGRSQDLRKIMPYLAAGATHYIGIGTPGLVKESLSKNDPIVQRMQETSP